MKIRYDPEIDAMYIKLIDAPYMESEEIEKDIIIDYSSEGKIIAIEILNVKKHLETIKDFEKISAPSP